MTPNAITDPQILQSENMSMHPPIRYVCLITIVIRCLLIQKFIISRTKVLDVFDYYTLLVLINKKAGLTDTNKLEKTVIECLTGKLNRNASVNNIQAPDCHFPLPS